MEQYEQYLNEYMEFMSSSHKSENTLASYKRDVKRFCDYAVHAGAATPERVTKTTVLTYLLKLQKEGKAAATVTRALAAVRSFFGYLNRTGVIPTDPTLALEAPQPEKKAPAVLSAEEVDRLLSCPDCRDCKGLRDKAMLELLYATGIRVSELIGLNLDDINLELNFLRLAGKKQERVVPVGHQAVEAVKHYLERSRCELVLNAEETALFVNCSGQRMTRQGFWKVVKDYGKRAGISEELTPHMLRHSFAAHMLENGADMKSIQELMGHADISSTMIYSRLIDPKIRDVYAKAHPRA